MKSRGKHARFSVQQALHRSPFALRPDRDRNRYRLQLHIGAHPSPEKTAIT